MAKYTLEFFLIYALTLGALAILLEGITGDVATIWTYAWAAVVAQVVLKKPITALWSKRWAFQTNGGTKMTNKQQFLNDLELEERIAGMSNRELSEFTARQTYGVSLKASSNERRIVALEKRGNRFIGIVGAIGTFIGAIVIATINYFAGK